MPGIVIVGDTQCRWGEKSLLEEAMRQAGVRAPVLALSGQTEQELRRLRPEVIVTMGNRSLQRLTGDDELAADRVRGYVWETEHASIGLLPTMHPADIIKAWVPWSTLFNMDLRKAKELQRSGRLQRPERSVRVVSSRHDAERAASELRKYGTLACDIENYDERQLACIGFAGRIDEAVVFPAAFIGEARGLLEDPNLTLVWQNGVYDLYFLLTRNGIRSRAAVEDTLLQWHCLQPELAGAAQGPKQTRRRTAKSLAFLSSLYTLDEWWKDYEFETEHERFVLNGRDCCITLDIWEQQKQAIEIMGVGEIYEHECGLVWPVVDMQAKGMRVDRELVEERIAALEERDASFRGELNELVMPLLEERWDRLTLQQQALFQQKEGVCECCRHASNKQSACWSCAGFDRAPSKKALVDKWFLRNGTDHSPEADPRKLKKAELEQQILHVCRRCGGEPRREWLEFNPNSNEQVKAVLYDLLKLPVRYNGGKPTADEMALKALLGKVA